MGTLVMGIGIGVVSTVGLTVAVVGTMVGRVEAAFAGAEEELIALPDEFTHRR